MQIMIGLVVGGVIGWLRPDWGNAVYFLRDIFINLIKSIIARWCSRPSWLESQAQVHCER
jgi:Na+/H+-dicarboxylate symporters